MHLKIIDSLKADKQNNIIQIAGLVMGIVTCIFAGQYVFSEYSFDKFNSNSELIYRTKGTEGMLLGSLAKEKLTYVENSARLHACYRGVTILCEDKSFHERKVYFADGSLFDIFSFPVVKGEATEALKHKNQMAISERYAKKYFGNENPVGKTLQIFGAYESNIIYTVAGVFKDIPKNSHVQFDILFSIENILAHRMYTEDHPWRWTNFFTYFKTSRSLPAEHFSSDLKRLALANGMKQKTNVSELCGIYPLHDIHLNGETNFMDSNRKAEDVNIRMFIALIILIIAWLNFVNIGIGSALKNKLTFSVKKVLGASSISIWRELFKKAVLLNSIAFVISAFVFIILKYSLKGMGAIETVSLSSSWRIVFWISVIGLQIIGAFFVSISIFGLLNWQKIAGALHNQKQKTKGGQSPWISLFVMQFGASIVLICFALLATKQVNGLMSLNKGIETEQVLAIHSANYSINGDIGSDRKVFEQEALKIPGVSAATSSCYIPGSTISSFMPFRLSWENEDANISCRINFVGSGYVPLFNQKILAGRNFSKEFPSEENGGVLINETLAKSFGFIKPDDAIGKEIYWEFKDRHYKIIGVMADFHHQSADLPVEPTIYNWWDQARGYCLLKVKSANPLATIEDLENLWEKTHKGNAFNSFWIDQHYQSQFDKWIQLVQVIKALTLIAIIIACIGLFGLSSMLLDKRTKEIGIRKVNGAKISEVLALLNKDFVKWVAIAFGIAVPLAYYAMQKWLENFAFKTELSWWIFALSGILALGIAMLTVSWQSWRVARRNPVEALRYE